MNSTTSNDSRRSEPDGPSPDESGRSGVDIARRAKRARRRQLITAALLGGLVGLVVSVVLIVKIYGRDLPTIDQERFESAQQRWKQNGIQSYDLQVSVQLTQPTVYDVRVRRGEVVEVKINDRPLTRRHAFDTWSVAGMFETISRDLNREQSPPTNTAAGKECKILLRGTFNEQYGFPDNVLRIETREKGSNPEVAWNVTVFQPVDPGSEISSPKNGRNDP